MKTLVKIWNVFTTLLVVFMMLMAVLLVGVRLVGLTPFTVLSGSMEPAYHVGSLIYVKETDPAKIEVGDPITYVVNEDLLVSTHRVVEIDVFHTAQKPVLDENEQPVLDEDGDPMYEEVPLEEPSYYFTTKGDANESIDGTPVYYKNVLGVPVFSLPYLGYLSSWLQKRKLSPPTRRPLRSPPRATKTDSLNTRPECMTSAFRFLFFYRRTKSKQ